jgi:hypothetical protein
VTPRRRPATSVRSSAACERIAESFDVLDFELSQRD